MLNLTALWNRLGAVFLLLMLPLLGWGQVTLVNFDFNAGTSYGTLSPVVATNITATASGTGTDGFPTAGGLASGTAAFAANATAGNALSVVSGLNTGTHYFQFDLGGTALSTYPNFKVYFQTRASGTGPATVTLSYSLNGGAYVSLPAQNTAQSGNFVEIFNDLTTITALNNPTTSLAFRITASAGAAGSTWRVDNFQVQSAPVIAEVLLPQFASGGVSGTNTNRVPYAFRATLSNLKPNAAYRYFTQAIPNGQPAITANAKGNSIFANLTGNFGITPGPALATAGDYGAFTASNTGTYTGWFILETNGNSIFNSGNLVRPVVVLNDGAGGTVAAAVAPTTNTVACLALAATSTDATALYGTTAAPAKSFVVSYDNAAGTGRPLYASFVEDDGAAETASYAAFYTANVNGTAGRYGLITPNTNANGIRRLESRALADGSLLCANTDADGVWPSGVNTVSPNTGITPLVVAATDAPLAAPGAITVGPGNAAVGAALTVMGTNFVQGGTTVTVGGAAATITALTSTSITTTVPSGAAVGAGQVVLNTTSTCNAQQTTPFTVDATTTPVLAASPATTAFTYVAGAGPSAEQSYSLNGSNLTAGPIAVTAPTSYEVSLTSGGPFTASVNVPYTAPTLAGTNVFVRLQGSLSAASYSGNVTNVGGGATLNVPVSASVTAPPTISVSTNGPLALGSTTAGTASTPAQTYTLSGSNLTGNLTLTAPTGVEISQTSASTGFAGSLTVTASGTLANTTIYVRIAATATAGPISGNVTNAGGGATTQNVAVSGTVNAPTSAVVTATPASLALGAVAINTAGTISTYTVSGNTLGTTPITITAPAGVELSLNGFVTSAATTLSLTPTAGTVASTTISVRIAAAASTGSVGTPITNVSGAGAASVAVTGTVATSMAPCFTAEGFEGGVVPAGWAGAGITISTTTQRTGLYQAELNTTTSSLTTPSLANPTGLVFYVYRTTNATLKNLLVQVSTTSQTTGFATVATYDHSNTTASAYTTVTVDLSAYNANGAVWVRLLRDGTGTTSPWRVDDVSATCGGAFPLTLTMGALTGSLFCVNQSPTTTLTVPYTVSNGTFGTGNVFTATISNATGSFATETSLGTVAAVGSGSITATISTSVPTGAGYRIRVKASSPATNAPDNGADLSVGNYLDNEVPDATAVALPGNGQATLSFVAPAFCATGVIVTIRTTAAGTLKPLAGPVYTANTAFGSGTDLGSAQYVVYNGAATGSVTVTGLTNGTQYFFQIFTTGGNGYSNGRVRSVRPVTPATLTEIVVPQLISGRPTTGSAHTTRLPYVWRATITGLTANATYKYYTAARASADVVGYGGAGVPIETKTAGAFVRGTGPSFGGSGSSLVADGTGSYTGWFGLEPTADIRFNDGATLFPMIVLDAGDGANVLTHFLPTTSAVTARLLATGASQATAVRGNSFGTPSNFVLTYDNTAGTGRPLAATYLEVAGNITNLPTANYPSFYTTSVVGTAGAYGLLTPNTNASGIQRVEQRALADGSLVGCAATDADGTWPGGATTVNPSGGNTTALVFTTGDTPFLAATVVSLSPASPSTIQQNATLTITGTNFTTGPRPTITFAGGATATAATVNATGTSLTVVVPGGAQSGPVSVTAGCGTVATSGTTITVVPLVFYTVTGAANLSLLASFTANADGSVGTVPASFTTANQVFNVLGTGRSFASNWTVSGTNSKVVLTANASLTIPTTAYFSGTIDQLANSALVVQNTSTAAISNLLQGVQDATSTIELAQAGTYAVPPTNGALYSLVYANLQLTNGTKTIPAPASGLIVNGNLTLSNTQVSGAVANASNQASAYSAIQLYGSYNQLSGVTYDNAAFSINLQLMNQSTAQNLNANGNTIALYRLYTAAVSGIGGGANPNAVGGILTGTGSVLELGNSFDGGLALYESSASLALNAGTTLRFVANGGGNIFVNTSGLLKPDPLANLEFNRNTINIYSLGVLRFTPGFTTVNNFTLNTTAPGAANTLTLTSDLTVNGTATIQAGTLVIGANTLTLNGSLSVLTGGFLDGSSSSNLTVGGTGTFGTLSFASGARVLNNLVMSRSGGTLTLGAPLTVDNILTLTNGIISTTAANLLTLTRTTAGAVVGGSASSYVNGPLARATATGAATVLFPIGKGTAYRPLTLNTAAQSAVRTYVAEQFNISARGGAGIGGIGSGASSAGAALTRVSNFRYFTLAPVAAAGTFSGTLTLSFGADDYANDPAAATFVVAKRANSGAAWGNFGRTASTGTAAGGAPVAGTLTSDVFATFSDFTLASTDPTSGSNAFFTSNPLPVELLTFSATRSAAGSVALAWATASEKNSASFEIERSLNGETFAPVGSVVAYGTTTAPSTYVLLDREAPAARLYARLRQVDKDGSAAYSAVRVVAGTGPVRLAAYPNPARTVLYFDAAPGAAYRLLALTGQVLAQGTTAPGRTAVPVVALPAGTYLLELTTEAGRQVQKFTKE